MASQSNSVCTTLSNGIKNHSLDNKQQLLDGVAKLNFDNIVNDQTISEESRAQIEQLSFLLKLAANIIENSMVPQIDNAAEMERRRSVVATGLPESVSDTPSERVAEDHNNVTPLLDQLGVECPVTSYRMGNRAPNGRPRPLKIVLAASKFQRTIITQWSKKRAELRKNPQMQRLNLRESLTPEQLSARREMQKECTAKRTQTGQDWIIYNDRLILRDDIKGKNNALFPPTISLITNVHPSKN
ncbi:hypothetical protein niasHT_034388 [Heterodera trifolii]|uniref:Uncharacterized protein n=1 Tax=Heterodera trifolii TaxID=157864 RepID=A0ABD2HZ86_9BILA